MAEGVYLATFTLYADAANLEIHLAQLSPAESTPYDTHHDTHHDGLQLNCVIPIYLHTLGAPF